MSDPTAQDRPPNDAPAEHDPDAVPERNDDERANREQIDDTGEPNTDALGNTDGAS